MDKIPVPITMPNRPPPASSGRASFPYNSRSAENASGTPVVSSATPNKPLSQRSPSLGNANRVAPSSSSAAVTSDSTPQAKKISSQRLNPNKCSDPFQTNTKRCKSTFSSSYVSGSIPCRLHTSASKYQLHWDQGAASGFSPDLLVVCADGLSETEHPYVVLAPMMFHELVLRAEGCLDMFVPIVDPLSSHIRKAMMTSETFDAALNALTLLLQHTGNLLAPHLLKIVPCLAKAFHDKKRRDAVSSVLGLMEQQCGPDATKLIKSKIPTY